MSDAQTTIVVTPVTELKAGHKVSPIIGAAIWQIADIVTLDSEGNLRIEFMVDDNRFTTSRFRPTERLARHVTLDEAVAEYHVLEREESDLYQRARAVGEKRASIGAAATRLGWMG